MLKNTAKIPKRTGRPLGSRNKRTVWREEAAKNALAAVRAHLTDDQIDAMDALDVMRLVMRTSVKAGDMVAALAAARDLAPFQHAKVQAIAEQGQIPADLLADPAPEADEPGPEKPIL